MSFPSSRAEKIDIILAADAAEGNVDVCNDHIWRLTTEDGEPKALSLSTTFGLRAYGMRIFPRFHMNGEIVTNPNSLSQYPKLQFYSSSFAEIDFKPFPSIDATLRLWVPASQILVGQVSLTLNTDQTESMLMEWAASLEPFPGGTTMSPVDQKINTILAGKTRDLEPVFLMTGMPRANSSAYPSLTLELALRPSVPRQFTWVLSSLENKDLSFYTARRYTASSLESEQLRQEILQSKQFFIMGSQNNSFDSRIRSSQIRINQLILPPFGKFHHPTLVNTRMPDHGYSRSHDGSDSGSAWGIQTSLDTFLAARMLLPGHPDILKGLLQNFLDQQGDNGTLDMLTSWTGKRSGKIATPLCAELALDLYSYTQDTDWLGRVFPQLLQGLNAWFSPVADRDQDGFPEWQHILQTGLSSPANNSDEEILETLVKCAESPALAALLYKECESLLVLADTLGITDPNEWLNQKARLLKELVQSCWNEKRGFFQYRDYLNHTLKTSPKVISYKRNGHFPIAAQKSNASSAIVRIERLTDTPLGLKIQIQTANQTLTVTERSFVWRGAKGLAVLDIPIGEMQSIDIRELKKSESLYLSEPAFDHFDASAIIPFWAGCASTDQLRRFVEVNLAPFEDMAKAEQLPAYIKCMLLETLIKNRYPEQALKLFESWYGKVGEFTEIPNGGSLPQNNNLDELDSNPSSTGIIRGRKMDR